MNTKSTTTTSSEIKTKWQQLVESQKGCKEYNPSQSFALQVLWVVRSPKAVTEMMEKGFKRCGKASMRDSPTTLAYIFRMARDQSLAEKFKSEVKTIGQHPHYQAAFKSIQMGIPRAALEMKLKSGGVDTAPLSWAPEEPIAGHEAELDFYPVVLECTEIYLDNRAFFEHTASQDWFKHYPEIMKTCRSLKPKTYCLGTPAPKIWETTLEPTLKAIRFTSEDQRQQVKVLQPGLHCGTSTGSTQESEKVLFFELELTVHMEKLQACRALISAVEQEFDTAYMVVFPTNLDPEQSPDVVEISLRFAFAYQSAGKSKSLGALATDFDRAEGRIISYGVDEADAQQVLAGSGVPTGKFSIMTSTSGEQANLLAGYPLHPLFRQLVPNSSTDFQL